MGRSFPCHNTVLAKPAEQELKHIQGRCIPPGQSEYTYHLQKGEVAHAHIVKINLDINPTDFIGVKEGNAVAFVVYYTDVEEFIRGSVDAAVILPCKEVDPHNAEDEPEDQAD